MILIYFHLFNDNRECSVATKCGVVTLGYMALMYQ